MAKSRLDHWLVDLVTDLAAHAPAGHQRGCIDRASFKQPSSACNRRRVGKMHPIDMYQVRDILDLAMTQIVEDLGELSGDMLVDRPGDVYSARLGDFLEARGYIDSVAHQVIAFGDDVADIDPDAEADLTIRIDMAVPVGHALLNRKNTPQRIDCAGELDQQAVAGGVGDAAAMLVDQRVDQFPAMGTKRPQHSFLILADQAGIARNICGHNRCQLAFLALHRRPPFQWPF
jgi:hypothetical protein